MAASLVMLSSDQGGPRKQLAEKAMRMMQLLDNDKPCNADDLDPIRVTSAPTRWVPTGAQASPRQQLPSHRRGPPRLSLQFSEGYECDVSTPNSRASRTPSALSIKISSTSSSASPRLAASRSCGSASAGSPSGSDESTPSPAYHTLAAGHVSAIRQSASTSALEPPSSVRRSSSGSAAPRRTAKTTRENNLRRSDQLDAASARTANASSSADACAAARSRPGPRSSSEMGGAAATRLAVPQSRQLRHNDTWHGESLDRLAIPRARTDVTRPSHHLSPREAPRLQLPRAAAGPGGQRAEPASSGSSHHPSPRLQLPRAVTNPGGQRAEPASCAPHHPSPRSSGGRAATRGTLKSGSDPDLAARESSFANSTTLTRVMPSAVAADSDTRAMLHAQPQRPSDRARGSTTTLSRQIPRPAALVIDCDAGDDDDVAELPLSARNHHASPASHTRQRRDRRSPGGPGANHSDSPRGTTVGKAQGGRAHGGRRSAVAQTSPPSSASPLDPASPSPTSPRFPCAIPSPRLIPLAAPTAYQQSPRQQVLPSASLGGSSPAIHRQSTIATGSPTSQPAATRGGQRRGSNGGGTSSSRQLSRFHTWDSALLDGEPTPQITPPPGPPSCREHRPPRDFSGRQHTEGQSEQLWAEGAEWEEGEWRGADGGSAVGGPQAAAATVHGAALCARPLTQWHSHSLQHVQPPVAEHPIAEHGIAEHLVALQPMAQHPIAEHAMVDGLTVLHRRSRTLDRRPAPSESLPDCHLPQRAACDERASRHARVGSHGGVCVHVQRVGGMAGAGENAQWVGGDEDWRMVQETPWKEEGEGEDVEATRGWQWEAEGDGLERGRVERHDPIQAQVPNPALVSDLGDGPPRNQTRKTNPFQHCTAVSASLDGSKQQSRLRGRPDGQRSGENDDVGQVRGSENKGSSKSREKPKSKLQRSLSDDEEEEQAKVVRLSRDGSSRLKQQGKRGAVLKV